MNIVQKIRERLLENDNPLRPSELEIFELIDRRQRIDAFRMGYYLSDEGITPMKEIDDLAETWFKAQDKEENK